MIIHWHSRGHLDLNDKYLQNLDFNDDDGEIVSNLAAFVSRPIWPWSCFYDASHLHLTSILV